MNRSRKNGFLERIADFFSSTKLALSLCLIIALVSVAGSFVYVGDTMPSGQGGVRLFSSPLFVVPAFLLVVNILVCSARRLTRARGRVFLISAHLFLVLCISGLLVDGRFGRVLTGYFPFEVSERTVFDWKEGKNVSLPFDVKVTEYTVWRHSYMLRIGVKEVGTGRKVGLYEVPEGGVLEVPGEGLKLTGFRFFPEEKKVRFLVPAESGPPEEFVAGSSGSEPIRGKFVIFPVAYLDRGVKEMKAKVAVTSGGVVSHITISPNNPGEYGGFDISLIESRFDRYMNLYLGFQFTQKPGEALFWVGILGFFLLVVIHFFVKLKGKGAEPEISPNHRAEGGV